MRRSPQLLFSVLALSISAGLHAAETQTFNRISSVSTVENLPPGQPQETETSAEIIAVSEDGNTLVYSDSPMKGVGLVDISNPEKPAGKGFISMEGEPTSVAVLNDTFVTGVNTSKSFTEPSGYLVQRNINTGKQMWKCDLGGQPDSVAVAKDGSFVAVAIENERDEDLNDGDLPQMPAGYLTLVPVKGGQLVCAEQKKVEMTGLAEIAPSDPEPEFVDINSLGEVVVTLQENNHLAIVNGKTGEIINHFPAGSVDLDNVDIEEERALTFDGKQPNRKREPDAVKWLDDERFVIANEGDYQGGSRGFTIFNKQGDVLYESGLDFEYRVAQAGHYPEKRSGNKGAEPEGLAVGEFNGQRYIFVLSERGSVVGVYRDTGAAPEFVQLLPSGIAPESAVTIPERGLFVTANEKDLIEDGGPRAHVMVYQMMDKAPEYPQIESVMVDGKPIGWGALSGLVADPEHDGILYAVNDSFYAKQPSIFVIDAASKPAKIAERILVKRNGKAAEKLDLEGITTDGNGGFWLASEGRTDKGIPHALYRTDGKGNIVETVPFPPDLLAVEKRFGAEGITRVGDTLWIAIQRSWKDDPENSVKLVQYNTQTGEWKAVRYPTEKVDKGWVGLSEITAYEGALFIIERDNQIGDNARVKQLTRVILADAKPAPLGGKLPLVRKDVVYDFLPDLKAQGGYVTDKIEGFAITKEGIAYAVTDNDGVDDSSGETFFFMLTKEGKPLNFNTLRP
ncbi:esterase-like activity of phytase family protein [Enterovibrio paralichthyis]|uniref:esterase-like activity of phytase family protein n=1 Tax=Enterovibrio paralichthyis TaxID=2853805 RepID=UPI001C4453AE|nr:esterase-like activity of phytase family protein [Enterovibrio paralichthyis]MBV7297211.1 esterase-like activity of phytase family protein [Enterovibrio paralichthyis]